METALKIERERRDTLDCFIFRGNIDAHAEASLKELPAQVDSPVVRFDFSEAGRINSMGIALLLRCLKNIKEEKKADISVSGLNPMNAMLFKMTGVFLLASQGN